MPIADTYVPLKSSGNGSTQDFSFNFYIGSTANLRVYEEDDVTGVQTLKSLGSDYTATFDDDTPGGNVHFLVAPATGKSIIRARSIPKTQETPLKTSSGFQATVIQTIVDKLTALVQDVYELISRAVKLPLGTSITSVTLPNPEDGKLLAWDGVLGTMKNVLASTLGAVIKATQALAEAASNDTDFMTPLQTKNLVQKSGAVLIPIANVDYTPPTVPVKATGAEIDAGIDDAKFATPKAIADSGLVSETAWTDYSATSTITGFASFLTKTIAIKSLGKIGFVAFDLEGVSNATSLKFTVPWTISAPACFVVGEGYNNGVTTPYPCRVLAVAGGSEIQCFFNMSNSWANSNTKGCYGQLFLSIA